MEKGQKRPIFVKNVHHLSKKLSINNKTLDIYGFGDFRRQVKTVAEVLSKTLDLAIDP